MYTCCWVVRHHDSTTYQLDRFIKLGEEYLMKWVNYSHRFSKGNYSEYFLRKRKCFQICNFYYIKKKNLIFTIWSSNCTDEKSYTYTCLVHRSPVEMYRCIEKCQFACMVTLVTNVIWLLGSKEKYLYDHPIFNMVFDNFHDFFFLK